MTREGDSLLRQQVLEKGFGKELTKALFPLLNPVETKLCQVLRSVLNQCPFPFLKEMTISASYVRSKDEVRKASSSYTHCFWNLASWDTVFLTLNAQHIVSPDLLSFL